ncbi:hypothetical protein [Aquimarina agarilytica]|uniref:hypothetical protein n=1 Tax=Aquimarina agarilytica TaxID=1087449 RepID=UPI000288D405|nr:hypothetical protein [Aquimarina agarilytica]
MKNSVIKLGLISALLTGITFTSCSDDDDIRIEQPGEVPTTGDVFENINKGILNGNIDKDVTLSASVSYKLTGIFSVSEGATLTIPAGTQIIANASNSRENYIAVLQGAKINVEGTISEPVLMISEKEGRGNWGGLVITGKAKTTEGTDATAEIGNLNYGGEEPEDNSGSVKNLVIRGAGAIISGDSQFNGLSLYAVGSGTTLENIAIIDGDDDGIEFFGGSASVKNLYVKDAKDDAIDWTEGWNGSITNAFVDQAIIGFSTVVEADGVNNNPTITNLTAKSTLGGGTALQFKKQSGATITGLSLSGFDISVDRPQDSPLANININGSQVVVTEAYENAATVDITSNEWDFIRAETQLFNDLPNEISADTTLDANIIYNLTGITSVKSGVTLTIPAGTRIIANGSNNTENYLVVLQGAKINIEGSVDNPVIMTSEQGNAGEWGGLVITGKASTTEGVNAIAEVGNLKYGGEDDTDNSGSIKNLQIVGSGAIITGDSQFNGLSLYAVGSNTVLENIAIINGEDDGVEFFGGTVNLKNLYVEGAEDDAIDWTEGWNGTLENAYVFHSKNFSTVVEADGVNNNPTIKNLTAVSTTDIAETGLQFKKKSGATITGLSLSGYDKPLDFPQEGPVANVQIEGADADVNAKYDAEATVDFAGITFLENFIK